MSSTRSKLAPVPEARAGVRRLASIATSIGKLQDTPAPKTPGEARGAMARAL